MWLNLQKILPYLFKSFRLLNSLGANAAFYGKWVKVPFLPPTIDVEPINACNFSCQHCQVTHWRKPKAELDERSFDRLLSQFPHSKQIKLQGMGEPFLNKDLVYMLAKGEKLGFKMMAISNGSILTQKTIEQLIQLNNTTIKFSIDGATAGIFEKMRPGSQFQKIKDNIKRLTHQRGGKKQPVIEAWTVLTRHNLGEAEAIVKFAKDLGVDRISLRPIMTAWGQEKMKKLVDQVKIDISSKRLFDAIEKAKQTAKALSLPYSISRHDNDSYLFSKENPCFWPWQGTYIAANGDVIPCCIIANSDVAKMGNVFEDDFKKIWNASAYRNLRRKIKTHNLPDYCKGCYCKN